MAVFKKLKKAALFVGDVLAGENVSGQDYSSPNIPKDRSKNRPQVKPSRPTPNVVDTFDTRRQEPKSKEASAQDDDNWLKKPTTISPELQQQEDVEKWRNDREKRWKAANEAAGDKIRQEDEKYRKRRSENQASKDSTVTSITGSGGTSYVSNLPGSREGGY